MRPIQGGPLNEGNVIEKMAYEPKVNGWRAMIHVPTLTAWTRHGEPLSIEHEFSDALQVIWNDASCEWLDCEMLSRRHAINKGKIIVLDMLVDQSYKDRRGLLSEWPEHNLHAPEQSAMVSILPSWGSASALEHWWELQQINQSLGVPYYEGLVAKDPASSYAMQLIKPSKETHLWVKHRFDQYK